MGDTPAALDHYAQSLTRLDAALVLDPDFLNLLRSRALAMVGMAKALADSGRVEEALDMYIKNLQALEIVGLRTGPASVWQRGSLARTLLGMSELQTTLGRSAEALANAQSAAELAAAMSAPDPDNVESRWLLGLASARVGEAELSRTSATEALSAAQSSAELLESLIHLDPSNARIARDFAVTCRLLGRAYVALSTQTGQPSENSSTHRDEALAWFERAHKVIDSLRQSNLLAGSDATFPTELDSDIATLREQ